MRKRSKYKPNKNLVNPLEYVLGNMKPVAEYTDLIMQTRLKNRMAVEALREGTATVDDIQNLIEMHNFVDRLIGVGFGSDYLDVLQKGQEALLLIARRTPRSAKFNGNVQELLALAELIDLNDAQLDVITIQDVRKAEKYAATHRSTISIELALTPETATA